MAKFCITYFGGEQPKTPEDGKKHMADYMAWLTSLGEAVVSPANPLKGTQSIAADGTVSKGSMVAMSGFTIIEMPSMEQALVAAKQCPFLSVGGKLEVAEILEMAF